MTTTHTHEWETVVGLEIHVQLNTRSKMFSRAPNRFGDEPNHNIGYTDIGQPGTLPLVNSEAVYKAVMFGLAVNADIQKYSRFDRKSYFYPDSPRNFQITQFEYPIMKAGEIEVDLDGQLKKFAIHHAHIEDDTGNLRHFPKFCGIDLNRAGAPLIEIVSMPCMHSGREAASYAKEIKAIMEYLNASDCNMDEGSLRVDINISVRPKGENLLRPKIEIKNINSFSAMEEAIEKESKRQIDLYTSNPDEDHDKLIPAMTYRYDGDTKSLVPMRTKETVDDYRYFPEPDIPPIRLEDAYIEQVKNSLPELPTARRKRYRDELKLSDYNTHLLVSDKALSDYFESALIFSKHPIPLCNWITVELVGRLKDKSHSVVDLGIPAHEIAVLVNRIEDKTITGRMAKEIADMLVQDATLLVDEVIQSNPKYQTIRDTDKLKSMITEVLEKNPQSIEDYHQGKDRAFQYLVGQVMKLTRGQADPALVRDLMQKHPLLQKR